MCKNLTKQAGYLEKCTKYSHKWRKTTNKLRKLTTMYKNESTNILWKINKINLKKCAKWK